MLLMVLATSCLERQFSEAEAAFSSDRTDIAVKSEDSEAGFVSDTLIVTANRSWTAEVVYDDASGQKDWISIGKDFTQHENIGNVSDTRIIPVAFSNNRYDMPRAAKIAFHYEGRCHYVNLAQGGITYRLVPSVTEINDITDVENVQTFSLDTNIPWKISIQEGSTADVEVLTPSGEGPAEISVLVKGNLDFSGKEAVLVIEADQGFVFAPVTVTLRQRECTPFLFIDRDRSKEEILPIESIDSVFFSTNGNWTAHLENASEGITLGQTSGSNKELGLEVKFGENFGKEKTGVSKSATVVIESNGLREEITITQKYWWQVKLVFHNGSSLTSSSSWPFLSPMSASELPSSSSKATYKAVLKTAPLRNYEGMSISIFATSGMWRNSSQGFDVKGGVGDYIEISGAEGMTLVGAAVTSGAAYFRMEMTDVQGKAVTGGEYKSSGWKVDVRQSWVLSGTQPSTPYRWTFSVAATSMIHSLEYFYQ